MGGRRDFEYLNRAPFFKRLSCEFQEVMKGQLMVVKATYECFGDCVCSEYTSLKMC